MLIENLKNIKNFKTQLLNSKSDEADYIKMYNLRYNVYCKELKFLDESRYPHSMEYDKYDPIANHFITSTKDGNVVGTVRLIKRHEGLYFPTEEHFSDLINILTDLNYPILNTAEISRLVSIDNNLIAIFDMFKEMYVASRCKLGITHWIATFEDSLYRLLKRYGIIFNLLLPDAIEYYGKVKIYGIDITSVEESMKKLRPDLYN
jgi:N-acyl-L-homoserine lactone synthetase